MNGSQSVLNSDKWFRVDFTELQLDIVGFLAILGEASVLAQAQVQGLTKWSYLPRLLPAPQALIRTARPERLDPAEGKVVGSTNGNSRPQINHVANIIHSGTELGLYEVKVVSVRANKLEPEGKTRRFSPVVGLSFLGAIMAAGLLIASVMRRDGFSTVATLLLSSLSTVIAIGSRWHLEFPKRLEKKVPDSDVIIKYPQGAFLVVKCDESVARKLYWAPETCKYDVKMQPYRALSLLGTLMLMGGVIMLANATNSLQLAWAIAYMILNAAYWVVAALPPSWNWDLSDFDVEEIPIAEQEKNISFTGAMWQAIAITREANWLRSGDIAPASEDWDEWLRLARNRVLASCPERWEDRFNEKGKLVLPEWDAYDQLNRLLNRTDTERLA